MGFFKPLGQLCNPSKVYLAISVITILSSLMTGSIFGIIFHAITVLLWAFFLGWLCDEGHSSVAWFLVLALPILMFIIIVVGLVFFLSHPASKRADMLDNIKSTSASETASDDADKADDDKKSSEGFYY
jgi:H+/Cl- antiporter ClcA